MKVFNRVKSFLERQIILQNYMRTPFHATAHILKIKLYPRICGKGVYKNFLFTFYSRDVSAIREVLKEEEYGFLAGQISETQRPVIIDAGAHIGLFSLWVFGVNPSAYILSLEASPFTFETLQANIESARGKGMNWQAQYGAAWGSNDIISFMNEGESMTHKIATGGGVQVQGVTLEQLVDKALSETGASFIDLLKVDIEGAEEQFLVAGEACLPKIKAMALELHPGSCNTENVMLILNRHYSKIIPQMGRKSTKPLLYCIR